jgi:hypothetical protein
MAKPTTFIFFELVGQLSGPSYSVEASNEWPWLPTLGTPVEVSRDLFSTVEEVNLKALTNVARVKLKMVQVPHTDQVAERLEKEGWMVNRLR